MTPHIDWDGGMGRKGPIELLIYPLDPSGKQTQLLKIAIYSGFTH